MTSTDLERLERIDKEAKRIQEKGLTNRQKTNSHALLISCAFGLAMAIDTLEPEGDPPTPIALLKLKELLSDTVDTVLMRVGI